MMPYGQRLSFLNVCTVMNKFTSTMEVLKILVHLHGQNVIHQQAQFIQAE
jgi:hypothetical protein